MFNIESDHSNLEVCVKTSGLWVFPQVRSNEIIDTISKDVPDPLNFFKIKNFYMTKLESILEKKSTLFGLVLLVVLGTLAIPIIIPHIFHGFHVLHIGLHVGGITLAVFISLIAILAYSRLKTKRLLFTAIAFSIFIVAELVLLVDATWPSIYDIGVVSLLEIGHILTITTLGLMAMGVFRND